MTILAAVTLVAVAVTTAALIALHVLPTGYSPLRDAVSDYGVGPYRRGYEVAAISLGIGWLCLAAAVLIALPRPGGVTAALIVAGAARIVIAAYPTDLRGGERTRTGRIHVLLALAAFGGIASAASLLAARTSHLATWHGVQPTVRVVGIAVVVMAIATGVSLRTPALARVFGTIERVLYLVFLGWTVVVAVQLIALGH